MLVTIQSKKRFCFLSGLLNRYLSEQVQDQDEGISVEQRLEEVRDEDKASQEEEEEEEEEVVSADPRTDAVLQDCFTMIVETLAKSNPKYVEHSPFGAPVQESSCRVRAEH